jgi:hypothetical protein
VALQATRLVADVWKDDPDTLWWIKEQAISNQNVAVRLSAAQALVKSWKEDPDTLKILKEHAQPHFNFLLRVNAVVCLACWWRDDPATLKLLKECAQSDESVLRLCTVWLLGRGSVPLRGVKPLARMP